MTRAGVPKQSDWKGALLRKLGENGEPKRGLRPNVANAITILTHDPKWAGVLAYDEFAETIVTRAAPPWRPQDAPLHAKPGDWTDLDTGRAQSWLADSYGIDCGLDTVLGAVAIVADRARVHPVRDWLDSLKWDAQRRLPTWLSDVFGCADTPYTRAVGTAWAVSAVARIYRPGCKVDTAIILEGKPGIFKSSILRAIAGDTWFLEMSLADVANKDAMQVLRRKWIGEFPEFDGLSMRDQAHVKNYFSRQVDTYRESYGKRSRDYPRQIVFAASTNKDQYITDETGGTGRRTWPIRCVRGDLSRARELREQIWAEAVARFQGGEEWHMRDPSLQEAEREEQDARYRPDPWEHTIATWLAAPVSLGGGRAKSGVATADVLAALNVEIGRRTHADASRVGAVLRRLGWVPGHPENRDGARVRLYRPESGAGTNGHTLVPLDEPAPERLLRFEEYERPDGERAVEGE